MSLSETAREIVLYGEIISNFDDNTIRVPAVPKLFLNYVIDQGTNESLISTGSCCDLIVCEFEDATKKTSLHSSTHYQFRRRNSQQ